VAGKSAIFGSAAFIIVLLVTQFIVIAGEFDGRNPNVGDGDFDGEILASRSRNGWPRRSGIRALNSGGHVNFAFAFFCPAALTFSVVMPSPDRAIALDKGRAT
jgi:hypothetical protein